MYSREYLDRDHYFPHFRSAGDRNGKFTVFRLNYSGS